MRILLKPACTLEKNWKNASNMTLSFYSKTSRKNSSLISFSRCFRQCNQRCLNPIQKEDFENSLLHSLSILRSLWFDTRLAITKISAIPLETLNVWGLRSKGKINTPSYCFVLQKPKTTEVGLTGKIEKWLVQQQWIGPALP